MHKYTICLACEGTIEVLVTRIRHRISDSGCILLSPVPIHYIPTATHHSFHFIIPHSTELYSSFLPYARYALLHRVVFPLLSLSHLYSLCISPSTPSHYTRSPLLILSIHISPVVRDGFRGLAGGLDLVLLPLAYLKGRYNGEGNK